MTDALQGAIPSQCPECREIAITVTEVPPEKHDRGTEWATRAECANCGEYGRWFD